MTTVMAKYTDADIRADIDYDTHDAWGSVMGALFDLCDAWYLSSGQCLSGYRPGLDPDSGLSWRAKAWLGFMDQGDITEDQVTYWFNILSRLRDALEVTGRSY
jgi:hypothetical protein